ncbi:MAG: hypothetical protein Kow0022_06180 [Phycisphaerales bacterium]
MLTETAESILPPALVFPVATLALAVTCLHLVYLQRVAMPVSRRRIRTVTGVLSLFTITLTAIGFGVVSSREPRLFLLTWLTVIGLLGILVLLAAVDMANNVRLHASERRHVRDQLARLQVELRTLARQRSAEAQTLRVGPDEASDEG